MEKKTRRTIKGILYGGYEGFRIFSPIIIAIIFLHITEDIVVGWNRSLFVMAIIWGLIGSICKSLGVFED